MAAQHFMWLRNDAYGNPFYTCRRLQIALAILFSGLGTSAMAQSTGAFGFAGHLNIERAFHTATLLTTGKVLVAGGFATLAGNPGWASAELYDPFTSEFSVTGSMSTSRLGHTATLLPDGTVLITGGDTMAGGWGSTGQSTAELHDPATETFKGTGGMTAARTFHRATLLNNGSILITGGYSFSADGHQISLASAELYDPSTGTFTATGNMIAGRAAHTATLLPSGKVLVEGGEPDSAELYDPATGTFSASGTPIYPDFFPSAASLLANGNVLTTFDSGEFDNKTVLYDSSTGESAPAANMTTRRGYSTATLLPEGRVLIDGRDGNHIGGSAELYDPVTGAFIAVNGMFPESEEGHTATLLPNGTVLLAGGWICCGFTVANAEIYIPARLAPSPVLYTLPGGVQGAILHGTTQAVVSPLNPAVAGEAIEIYGAGLIDGSVIPPQVAIGGRLAPVLYFGNAPGFPGLNQINVQVPNGLGTSATVSVRLIFLNRPSNEVTVAVQ